MSVRQVGKVRVGPVTAEATMTVTISLTEMSNNTPIKEYCEGEAAERAKRWMKFVAPTLAASARAHRRGRDRKKGILRLW